MGLYPAGRHRPAWKAIARVGPPDTTFFIFPVTVRLLERATDEALPIEADLPNGIHLRIPTVNEHLACRLVRAVARARTNSGGSR
jgi:hypothetical protein